LPCLKKHHHDHCRRSNHHGSAQPFLKISLFEDGCQLKFNDRKKILTSGIGPGIIAETDREKELVKTAQQQPDHAPLIAAIRRRAGSGKGRRSETMNSGIGETVNSGVVKEWVLAEGIDLVGIADAGSLILAHPPRPAADQRRQNRHPYLYGV